LLSSARGQKVLLPLEKSPRCCSNWGGLSGDQKLLVRVGQIKKAKKKVCFSIDQRWEAMSGIC